MHYLCRQCGSSHTHCGKSQRVGIPDTSRQNAVRRFVFGGTDTAVPTPEDESERFRRPPLRIAEGQRPKWGSSVVTAARAGCRRRHEERCPFGGRMRREKRSLARDASVEERGPFFRYIPSNSWPRHACCLAIGTAPHQAAPRHPPAFPLAQPLRLGGISLRAESG